MNLNQCPICHIDFSRRDVMLRHQRNVHPQGRDVAVEENHRHNADTTFQHPFSMVVSGPSGSGKTRWTKQLLNSSLIQPSPQRIIYCYGQWQPLYMDLKRSLPRIEFIKGIPDRLDDPDFIDGKERLLIVFDDLMTEAKCDQRLADMFTKGSHHRNMSVVYLTQNIFPQGKACRDIALNTQYLVLFNNPMDRQQVATLARRMYPLSSGRFMKRFEEAVQKPYGYLVVDLKATTPEQLRLNSNLFPDHTPDEADNMDLLPGRWMNTLKRKREDEDDATTLASSDRDVRDYEEESDGDITEWHSPPGTRHHKIRKLEEREDIVDHDMCPAGHTTTVKCILRELVLGQVRERYYPELAEEAKTEYPECSRRLAERKLINDKLPELRKLARYYLSEILAYIQDINDCPMYDTIMTTAKKLHRTSHISMDVAIREVVRMYKADVNKFLIEPKNEEESETNDSDDESKEEAFYVRRSKDL